MSVIRIDAPAVADPTTPRRAGNFLARWLASPWPWLWVLDAIVSFFILRWAKTSPGYDPYGWLSWGYQTWHGHLDLLGAPSWKPITYLFTLPYTLAGIKGSWWLWRITALTVSNGGLVAGGLIAYRLVRRDDEPIWPALVAFLWAFVGIAMIVQYWHYILSSQSDSLLVTCVLLSVNQMLSKRWGWATVFLVACGLGRPEDWIILGPLGLWLFLTRPDLRWLLIAELGVMAFLWFIVPVIAGAPWDIAQKLAQHSVRELHSDKFFGTIHRYFDLTLWPVLVSAAGTFLWAILRRDLRVVGLAVIPILWMVIELWFVLSNGFPGVPRYMFEAAATTIVLSAVGIGWLARIALGSGAGILSHESLENDGRRLRGQFPAGDPVSITTRVTAAAVALALIGFMVPYAKDAWDYEHTDIQAERVRSHSIVMLQGAIRAAGGPAFVTACGTPTIDVGTASILAYYTHNSTAHIGYIPERQIASHRPTVLFTGLFNGFALHTYGETPAQASRCSALNDAYYLVTSARPHGEFIHLSH